MTTSKKINLFRRIIRKIKWVLRKKEMNLPISSPVHDKRIENFIRIIDEGYGNKQSFLTQRSINSMGEPIPWFTYPSIQYLSQLDLHAMSILEWGIGNSTLFFAKRKVNVSLLVPPSVTIISTSYNWLLVALAWAA